MAPALATTAAATRNGHGWLASFAILCILSLLFHPFPFPTPGAEQAGLVALAVSGAGSAILCLLWLRSLAKAPYRDTITVIGGSFVLATTLTSLAFPYPDAAIAISVFSIILSRFLLPYPQPPDEGGEEEKNRCGFPPWNKPTRGRSRPSFSRRRGAKAGESPSGPSLIPEETAKPDR